MIGTLLPYHEYKDSGLAWLGCIPSHWNTERAKWLFQKMTRPVEESHDVVTCFRDGTVTLRKNRRTLGFTNSLKEIGYQGVYKGDLVIHAMDAFAGAVGVSDSDGKCTPVYAVCTAKIELDNRYYAYLIREMARSQWILALARGIRERSTDFRFDTFAAQLLPIPSLEEQKIIANYLDNNAVKIRRFIRNRRRLIEVLNEQKQAIINQAITRGLDPNAPFKPSDIEWLGDIPEHWQVLRSKYLFREVDTRSTTGEETHLSMSQRYGLIQSSEILERRLMSESYIGGKLCEKDDLILNRLKAHLGVFALASEPGIVSPDYTIFRARRKLIPAFFEYFYRTPLCRVELRKRAKGIVQGFWRLYTDDFYDIPVPVPPVYEQQKIVDKLAKELAKVNAAIDIAYREIGLIGEYRMRLMADVITGKLDVRHLASQLINDSDNGNLLVEDEEFFEDSLADTESETEEVAYADD